MSAYFNCYGKNKDGKKCLEIFYLIPRKGDRTGWKTFKDTGWTDGAVINTMFCPEHSPTEVEMSDEEKIQNLKNRCRTQHVKIAEHQRAVKSCENLIKKHQTTIRILRREVK